MSRFIRYNFRDFINRYISAVEDVELFRVLEKLPAIGTGKVWLAGAVRRTLMKQPLDTDVDYVD